MTRDEFLKHFPHASEDAIRRACNDTDSCNYASANSPVIKQSLIAQASLEKPRLRQRVGDGMNKTERAFFEWLRAKNASATIHREVALPIGNGVRYKPDFLLSGQRENWSCDPVAYEVKGFMRDDAAVKIKVAASVYPWIRFVLVWRKGRNSEWQFQEIKA